MVEQEKYILAKHVHISIIDAENMTVSQRKMHIKFLMNDVDQQKREQERANSQSGGRKITTR